MLKILRKAEEKMTEFKGSILELNDKHAIVMTENCDFISVKKQPDMFVGQQLKFRKSDMIKAAGSYMKFTALAAGLLVLILCSVLYFQLFSPNNVFAYIDLDINPSIEFSINKDSRVIAAKPLNTEAETLLESLKLADLPVKQAITHVIDSSEKLGYVSGNINNEVLVSASIAEKKDNDKQNSADEALDSILSEISTISIASETGSKTPEVMKVSPQVHKTASENNISMGRYELYEKMKKSNPDLTVENAKTAHVSDMLNSAAVKNSYSSKDKKTGAFYDFYFNKNISRSNVSNTSTSGNTFKYGKETLGAGFGNGGKTDNRSSSGRKKSSADKKENSGSSYYYNYTGNSSNKYNTKTNDTGKNSNSYGKKDTRGNSSVKNSTNSTYKSKNNTRIKKNSWSNTRNKISSGTKSYGSKNYK